MTQSLMMNLTQEYKQFLHQDRPLAHYHKYCLFDVGVFGPIIFGINLIITAFKPRFQNILGKGIVEAIIPKTDCLKFMVIP